MKISQHCMLYDPQELCIMLPVSKWLLFFRTNYNQGKIQNTINRIAHLKYLLHKKYIFYAVFSVIRSFKESVQNVHRDTCLHDIGHAHARCHASTCLCVPTVMPSGVKTRNRNTTIQFKDPVFSLWIL